MKNVSIKTFVGWVMSKTLFQSELIRAGAGTGKTYQLIEKIYSLFELSLKTQKKVPRLIVCTFTRKATQELKERLFEKSMNSFELNQALKDSFLDYISSSALQLGTIDSILFYLLKNYGQSIHLNPDFEVSSLSINDKLFDSFSESFLYKKHSSLLEKMPYPHLKELLLFYYKCQLQYGQLSFYDKIDFQSFKKEIEEFYPSIQGAKKGKLLGEELYNFYNNYVDSKDLKNLLKEEDSFKAQNFIPVFKEFQKVGEEFFNEFLKLKKSSRFLDMEDLLLFSNYLLNTQKGVAQQINKEWDYWLIDEYQDTSLLQDQVIEKITGFKNVFCVGDPGQSIYTFRGADPEVFKNREKKMIQTGGMFKRLSVNRRSSAELISFYNDFFLEDRFLKFESLNKEEESQRKDFGLTFFTYQHKEKESKLQALYHYIKDLKQNQKASYSDIAILCAKNKELLEIYNYLKRKGVPLALSGSKKISQNRVVLDSLFLLKFLINPFDDNNLKSLLRTPYFRLSDQELAYSSYDYEKLMKNQRDLVKQEGATGLEQEGGFEKKAFQDKNSFWAFIREKYQDRYFVESLSSYLENYKKEGLFHSFKKALFDSGLMDLADFQDATGSSSASLWKCLSLLKNSQKSALEIFYDLTERDLEKDSSLDEVMGQSDSELLELMTIHKSKGLQFKHVIVSDSSMGETAKESQGQNVIYDLLRKRMSFSVPLGSRDKKKIKSYGHKIYNSLKRNEKIKETDHVFYVAMTRAEKSLALFIPEKRMPRKNSWLSRVSYFNKIDNLLNKGEKFWSLNTGTYDQGSYFLTVKNCMVQNLEKSLGKDKSREENIDKQETHHKLEKPLEKSSKHNVEDTFEIKKEGEFKNREGEALLKEKVLKSSQDFISYKEHLYLKNLGFAKEEERVKREGAYQGKGLENKKKQLATSQGMTRYSKQKDLKFFQSKSFIKNRLFKTDLGTQLHFFLEKSLYFSKQEMQVLIENQEEQTKLSMALDYVFNLKEPDFSHFLKEGFSEWSFKLQKENFIFHGQIDLWTWLDSTIHLVDYKSSAPVEKGFNSTKNQLVFYGWILNELYKPKQIMMYECYPLKKITKKIEFQEEHKTEVDVWIEALKRDSS